MVGGGDVAGKVKQESMDEDLCVFVWAGKEVGCQKGKLC